MEQIVIREIMPGDGDAVCRINKETLGYEFPPELTAERLECIAKRTNDRIFVAVLDGEIVGYIHGSAYECTYHPSMKNVLALAVLKQCQGRGIGHQLIERLEDWAREDSCAGVRLVSGHNREMAHQFYLKCGYFMRKEQKNFMKLF